jgi:hypothetical protein
MGDGRIKVDGTFEDAKREEASGLIEEDKAATWGQFVRLKAPQEGKESGLLTNLFPVVHTRPTSSTQF